jgi:hypothetical protein
MAWLPVADWEDLYEVSDRGQVRSLDRVRTMHSRKGNIYQATYRGIVLRLPEDKDGYLQVNLKSGNRRVLYKVGPLVLTTFDRPKLPGEECLHGELGRQVNWWPENLRWDTHAANIADKIRDHTTHRGEHASNKKLTYVQRCEVYRLAWLPGANQRVIGAAFGISHSTVSSIKLGKHWVYSPEEW